MKLPNATQAVVPLEKIVGYCLNPQHRTGRHKARVFESALGWTDKDALLLRTLLLNVVQTQEANSLDYNAFGRKYELRFSVAGISGMVEILSIWIIMYEEDFPRLVTCYVVSE